MIRVLIADNDLDSHEVVDDLVEMLFRDVKIDRSLSRKSLLTRIGTAGADYDLVIFNYSFRDNEIYEILEQITLHNPDLLKRIVFIITGPVDSAISDNYPVLMRPLSIDEFSDTVKKICATSM